MARYKGPKDRLSRREGFDLFGKGSKFTRLMVPPGMHGQKRRKSQSQYGKQLREKQKVKRIYGVLEKQFRKYVNNALKSKGNTGEIILSTLELRLDNVVFRLGFTSNRPSARQIVSHRHILVNGKKLNIPSYQVKIGDTISLSSKAISNIEDVKRVLSQKEPKIPSWLRRKAVVGQVLRKPKLDDVLEPISMQDIIEFYSR
ncbi:30S ribosomal protein S4 [Patescibacteria group bacterium]|nr:30S ribosomal protein S4 [Patescibacteria group bacterium]